MAKVKLGEVAREYKATVKDVVGLPVVGLEHLIPGQVELTQWSEDADNTFTKGFQKGQMLFGRRRAYLKKAALAPFDGICSGDITVIEAIPERIMPELLPFVIQNDSLFDYAVEKSAGSLSPRVKWEHLKNYEFELPEIEHQRELVDLLWAMARTKKAYQELVKKTDELVKSQFIEMFGNEQKQMRLEDLCKHFGDGDWIESKDQSHFVDILQWTFDVGGEEIGCKTEAVEETVGECDADAKRHFPGVDSFQPSATDDVGDRCDGTPRGEAEQVPRAVVATGVKVEGEWQGGVEGEVWVEPCYLNDFIG